MKKLSFIKFGTLSCFAFILIPVIFAFAPAIDGQEKNTAGKRRALLIGIGNYLQSQNYPQQCEVKGVMIEGRGELSNLCGPQNDVRDVAELLKSQRYNFGDINILPEQEATRTGILNALEQEMLVKTAPGDTFLFYFNGHGSLRKNSLSGEEYDQTLVPADAKNGVKDIRDKELVRLFHKALDRNINLIIIVDSCHSGSIAKGNFENGRKKNIRPDETDIKQEICPAQSIAECRRTNPKVKEELCPYFDKTQNKCLTPAERGALILTASEADEVAKEVLIPDKNLYGGIFTQSFLTVIRGIDAQAISADEIRVRVADMVKANGYSQNPTIDANEQRKQEQTLLGEKTAPESKNTITAVVSKVVKDVEPDRRRVELSAGLAYGVVEGSQFVNVTGEQTVYLQVEDVALDSSSVTVIGDSDGKLINNIKPNDLFKLDKWVQRGAPRLQIWLPESGLTTAELNKILPQLVELKKSSVIEWISDPVEQTYNSLIFYHQGEQLWKLEAQNKPPVSLGSELTSQGVLRSMTKLGVLAAGRKSSDKPRLYVDIPLPKEIREKIRVGFGQTDAIRVVRNHNAPFQYSLSGRMIETAGTSAFEYSWVLASAVKGAGEQAKTPAGARSVVKYDSYTLPVKTDWFLLENEKFAESLNEYLWRLGRIRGLLRLSEENRGNSELYFPYKLQIRNKGTDKILPTGGEMIEGQAYEFVFILDKTKAITKNTNSKINLYIINVDSRWEGNVSTQAIDIGIGKDLPAEIRMPGFSCKDRFKKLFNITCASNEDIGIRLTPKDKGGTFGNEIFLALATDRKITNPAKVLQFEGVTSGVKAKSGNESSLESYFLDIDEPEIKDKGLPTNWLIYNYFYKSVEQKPN